MSKGLLISIEGPDGAGKTSVLEALLPRLKEVYPGRVITTREPGGVVILDVDNTAMDAKTELLLYIAARRQHLVEKVLPELEKGNMVIMDRFIDSSVAYQGAGRGLDQTEIAWLNTYATDGHKPDVTLLFDVDSETGLKRIAANGEREVNRLDLEKLDMHQRVRKGYLDLAMVEPERIKLIDASQPFDKVIEDAWQIIKSYL